MSKACYTGVQQRTLGNNDQSDCAEQNWNRFLDICKQIDEYLLRNRVFVEPRRDESDYRMYMFCVI